MNQRTEREIIDAVLSGDKGAYDLLVESYQNRIYRYCLTLLTNPVEAEEATQDVFVKAYESLLKFEARSSFFTWIAHIAHNHCMDLLEKRNRRKADSIDNLLTQGWEPASREPGVDEPQQAREELSFLQRVLSSLRPEYREILVLREIGELSYDDIAERLRCSLDAVKSRLRRARQEAQEIARHVLESQTSIERGQAYESR